VLPQENPKAIRTIPRYFDATVEPFSAAEALTSLRTAALTPHLRGPIALRVCTQRESADGER